MAGHLWQDIKIGSFVERIQLTPRPIPDDGNANRACYNDELAATPEDEKRWYTMNWLFAECYLYRLLRSLFAMTEHWKQFDPFFSSKMETYRSSSVAIGQLAGVVNGFVDKKDALQKDWDQPKSPMEVAFW